MSAAMSVFIWAKAADTIGFLFLADRTLDDRVSHVSASAAGRIDTNGIIGGIGAIGRICLQGKAAVGKLILSGVAGVCGTNERARK